MMRIHNSSTTRVAMPVSKDSALCSHAHGTHSDEDHD